MSGTGSGYSGPEVTGEWMTGNDKTANRIELAPTAKNGVLALRSTFGNQVMSVTPSQILAFADDIRGGAYGHLIQN